MTTEAMMAGVNLVILVGNLGKDPELFQREGKDPKCTFTLATTKKTNDGDKTEWHNVVLWGRVAEVANDYLTKGRQVYLRGEIRSRPYEDANGNKRYITEIVCYEMQMLGSRDETSAGNDSAPQRSKSSASKPERDTGRSNSMPADDGDDLLPF